MIFRLQFGLIVLHIGGLYRQFNQNRWGVGSSSHNEQAWRSVCLGRKGPNQFDCSGLTQWSFKQVGVNLGPDTYTQIKQGKPVPKGQVQQGDLIFPGIGHVQLAIRQHR